jgi:hypothetical protein
VDAAVARVEPQHDFPEGDDVVVARIGGFDVHLRFLSVVIFYPGMCELKIRDYV